MRVFESPGTIQRFRRTTWEFQRTFETPLGQLPRFVEAIVSALPAMRTASIVFDQVVFEPSYALPALYAKYSLPPQWYGDNVTIEAASAAESRELLQAVLSEWIDFVFVPTPKKFVIDADHDEYATFLAHRRSQLAAVVEALSRAKFRAVDYVRKL